MSTTPFIKVVPSGAAPMFFDLANGSHKVEDSALGPSGELSFSASDWARGMLSVEEGVNHVTGKYLSAKGGDASFPGQVILQPQATTVSVGSGPALGAIVKQLDFIPSGGTINTYLIESGRYVHKLVNPSSNPIWTVARDTGASTVGQDGVVHGGRIAVAYDTGFDHSVDGSTWTADTNDADAFGVLGDNVWRADENSLYSATALNGTWSSAYTAGDSGSNVNSLLGLEQVLMIGKTDGIYSVDADGTIVPFTPELRTQANANFASPGAVGAFNGDYYFRTLNGLLSISGVDGQKRRVGLDQLASPDIPTPVVRSLAWDDRYLYALCDNTSTDLMILRRSIYGSWHVFYWDDSAGTKQGRHIAVSSAFGYPCLFFSYYDGSSTYTTKYIRLSTFPNPLQDSNYRFDTSSGNKWVRAGRFGSAEAQMLVDRLVIQSRSLTANVTITPYYSADGGAITQFGSTAATSSPLTTITPTTAITCNFIDLYFYLASNSTTATPVLTGFSLKGVWRPGMRRIHTFTVPAASYHGDNRSGAVRRSPVQTISDLQTLRTQGTYATITDENGQTFSGVVINVSRAGTRLTPANQEPEHAIQFTVMEKA